MKEPLQRYLVIILRVDERREQQLLVITTTTTAMTHLLRSIFSLENSTSLEPMNPTMQEGGPTLTTHSVLWRPNSHHQLWTNLLLYSENILIRPVHIMYLAWLQIMLISCHRLATLIIKLRTMRVRIFSTIQYQGNQSKMTKINRNRRTT